MLQVKISVAKSLPVTLFDSGTGLPKTGVVFGDVSCFFTKQEEIIETTKSLSGNFTEISSSNTPGLYFVDFSSGDLGTLGLFTYKVSGAGIESFEAIVQVVTLLPAGILTKIGDEDADADGQVH